MPCQEATFSTSYFPPIAQMAAMIQEESFVIEQHETFPKQTHRNRTIIVTAGGPMVLTVPVIKKQGVHTLTKDIEISYSERWNVNHWRSIEAAYNSSPYFLYYRDEIERELSKKHRYLLELNCALLELLIGKLHRECNYSLTSDYIHHNNYSDKDYRYLFSYKHPDENIEYPHYTQVFEDRMPFQTNVGILDLLFNMGPESGIYLSRLDINRLS